VCESLLFLFLFFAERPLDPQLLDLLPERIAVDASLEEILVNQVISKYS